METQLIKKLGLQNHKTLLEKTTELLRLLELKSSTVISGINDYAKIYICIDLAAALLGVSIELVDVIKQSGLKKYAYEKHKRTFQKLLDLNKPLRINEICVHLNCNEIALKANNLFNIYKEYINKNNENDIDLSHPQYSAMAVFQACKLNKVKILKPKILGFSHLRPSQWSRLEQQWDKLIKENGIEMKNVKLKSKNTDNLDGNHLPVNEKVKNVSKTESEDYETWKARIIHKAREELKKKYQGNIEYLNIESMDIDDSF